MAGAHNSTRKLRRKRPSAIEKFLNDAVKTLLPDDLDWPEFADRLNPTQFKGLARLLLCGSLLHYFKHANPPDSQEEFNNVVDRILRLALERTHGVLQELHSLRYKPSEEELHQILARHGGGALN
jgi:hypothetical protein